MPISSDIWHAALPTANIFGEVQEKNVTFLIDTSGSMYSRLDVVKQHLKEFLKSKSLRGESRFNMIEFNSNVTQWSDKMVQCRSETIKVAEDWINKLEAKSGTNTEAALLAAYDDSECDVAYLVTDGLPDSKTHNILDSVACVYDRRPTHCIYITGRTVDDAAIEFLQDLATETYGSFKIVTVTNHGSVERIAPVYMASHGYNGVVRTSSKNIFPANQKQCSVTSTLDNPELKHDVQVKNAADVLQSPFILPMSDSAGTVFNPRLHPGVEFPAPRVFAEKGGSVLRLPYFNYAWSQWYQPYLWARYRTARSWLQMPHDLEKALEGLSLSPAAGALLIDQPVLARMTEDGLYYKGTVKSQISCDKFLVELIPQTVGKYIDITYHEVFIFDIVQYVDARRHAIEKDDKVLAPLNDRSEIFCPGVVISGQEARDSFKDNRDDEELIVMFADGRSASVLPGEALWISQQLYDRVAFEMKLPSKVRRQISDMVSDYPEESYPGYPVTAPECQPREWEQPRKFNLHGKDALYQPNTGLMMSEVHDVDTHVFGTDMTKSELTRKVNSQIKHHEHELRDSHRTDDNRKFYHKRRPSFDDLDDLTYSRARQPIRQSNSHSPTTLRPRPRSARSRTRSLSPRSRNSVRFDESLNERRFYNSTERLHRRSYPEEYEKVDSSTNTPLIRNGRVLKLKEAKDERPPWKYWKADTVPAMIDPPYHEPYNQSAVAEPLELRNSNISTGVIEWGNSHFNQVVPNGRTNFDRFLQPPTQKSVSFQANTNTSVCPGSNLVYRQTNKDRNLQLRQYHSQMEHAAMRNSNKGVPGAMQDNYNSRILAQMGREKTRGILSKKQIESTVANKERLNAQLSSGYSGSSYQREINATSYSRQVAAMNQAAALQSTPAKRITAMSARRQDRDMLQAARVLQQDSRKSVVVI